MTNTPILAIDIDGVLSPLTWSKTGRKTMFKRGFRPVEWRQKFVYPENSKWCPYSDLYLHPQHGKMLAQFSARHDVELIWCSLWADNANRIVSPALGLPRLPFVDFHGHSSGSEVWKWDAVAEYAAGRPLAWLDDGFSDAAKRRALSGFDHSRRNLPTLLKEIDPYVGLGNLDLVEVLAWLRMLAHAW